GVFFRICIPPERNRRLGDESHRRALSEEPFPFRGRDAIEFGLPAANVDGAQIPSFNQMNHVQARAFQLGGNFLERKHCARFVKQQVGEITLGSWRTSFTASHRSSSLSCGVSMFILVAILVSTIQMRLNRCSMP